MRNEDYGRIARILADGTPVTLEFNIVNSTLPGRPHVVITRSRKFRAPTRRDEVVMLGGHLDSWHSATGATDNAIGCAAMMEAVRLLKAIGVKPRRTIRLALWTGEEHGLLGSQAYVRAAFRRVRGTQARFLAAVRVSESRHRHRPNSRRQCLRPAGRCRRRCARCLRPLPISAWWASRRTARRSLGDTDSTTFNAAGLPGINFDQDPIQYDAATHHTSLDTYERIVEDDVRAVRDRHRGGGLRARDARRPAAAIRQEHDAVGIVEVGR